LGQVLEDTGSGLKDVTKTALNDATGLAAGAGLGALGLVAGAGMGAHDLIEDAGSGATSLLRDAGSGVVSLLQSNPANVGQPYSQGQGTAGQTDANGNSTGYYAGSGSGGLGTVPTNQFIDPYSYNGALVSKGSNYIPVTDDFSAFRK
jgi:hypothetical protein